MEEAAETASAREQTAGDRAEQYHPPTAVNTTQRLRELRDVMRRVNISAYIIPHTDAHLSEYISEMDARVAFISGFTGSSGTAVVTQSKAVLFTDSRYWIQATRQMYCIWDLVKSHSVQDISDWLRKEVSGGDRIGFSPFLFSFNTFKDYHNNLAPANLSLTPILDDLVEMDEIWRDRPSLSPEKLFRLPDEFIGRSWQSKVEEIRRQMRHDASKPTAVLLSALDETAWLFNLRGNDIPYSPLFFSYTLLSLDQIWLFVNISRVTNELKEYLNSSCTSSQCVQLFEYDSVGSKLPEYFNRTGVKVLVSTKYINKALYDLIPEGKLLTTDYSPVMKTKAVKNPREQEALRITHVKDAVAVIQLLVWLEKNVPKGTVTELTAANYIDQCRRQQEHNRGPSFKTTSASGPNSALPHYKPSNRTARTLTVNEIYFIDSGGQYLSGTTDITRTVHWGEPTQSQKKAYTQVLMAIINISRNNFSAGTNGKILTKAQEEQGPHAGRAGRGQHGTGTIRVVDLRVERQPCSDTPPTQTEENGLGVAMDKEARKYLRYQHGTGHGLGNYLVVHEAPVGFGSDNIPFQEGMFISIEPGYYKENDFGLRIEDIAVIVPTKNGSNNCLTFDIVTMVPYDRNLINESLLSTEQIEWLNKRYKKIRELIGPELKNRKDLKEEYQWMKNHTEPFHVDNVVRKEDRAFDSEFMDKLSNLFYAGDVLLRLENGDTVGPGSQRSKRYDVK
ncbi:xaa-Pro aminopeptidase 2-like [Chanos chanos]|uniref:Xaa-Pro aminopeptidase 2-like n=1 Tax=Chanos chanos TaxID=29144 RepID=A0A6J2US62_CHACN|nr:xaa-Pro aminopeptidase 2-like [Chanos chanos]